MAKINIIKEMFGEAFWEGTKAEDSVRKGLPRPALIRKKETLPCETKTCRAQQGKMITHKSEQAEEWSDKV